MILLFLGGWFNYLWERRPLLITHYGHVSGFWVTPPGGQAVAVHTHSVVVRNAGRRSATNVRLRHHVLPNDYSLWPEMEHRVEEVAHGARELIIPTLVPGEQVTIS